MARGTDILGSLRLALAALLALVGVATATSTAAAAQAVELIMFEETGCPWCRRWDAEVGVGYPHSSEGRRAPLRRLQIGSPLPAGIELARPVRASPTFVLVKGGREVGRITGYPGADFFWPMLDDLLRKLDASGAGAPRGKQREARAVIAGAAQVMQ